MIAECLDGFACVLGLPRHHSVLRTAILAGCLFSDHCYTLEQTCGCAVGAQNWYTKRALHECRVWFFGGQLHIIPLSSAACPNIPSLPTATQALQLLRSDSVPTLAGLPCTVIFATRVSSSFTMLHGYC